MDTLALGYTLPAIGRVTDSHRLENVRAGRTTQKSGGEGLTGRISAGLYIIPCLCLQHAEHHVETGCDNGYHAHQLDENVERRTGSILEGIAYGVTYDGSLVGIGALAAEVAFLHVFLGVVPGTAGVGPNSEGSSISCWAPLVEMATQRA